MHRFKTNGFTIVELLIVIVVIAILAAISVVAYNGIQDRTNDSAIKSDIGNLVKKVLLYEAEFGELPKGGSSVGNSANFPGITFLPSKLSYSLNYSNLWYCQGAKSGVQSFSIVAQSKSSAIFAYTAENGLTKLTSGSTFSNCRTGWDDDLYTESYGYNKPNNQWHAWTNG